VPVPVVPPLPIGGSIVDPAAPPFGGGVGFPVVVGIGLALGGVALQPLVSNVQSIGLQTTLPY
jgi:hypothetical protein